jgi:hypothetical protein
MKSLFPALVVLSFTNPVFASLSCPDFTGKYKDARSGEVFVISQDACSNLSYFQDETAAAEHASQLDLIMDGIDHKAPGTWTITNSAWAGVTIKYRTTEWFDIDLGHGSVSYTLGQISLSGGTLTWSGQTFSMGEVVEDSTHSFLKIK